MGILDPSKPMLPEDAAAMIYPIFPSRNYRANIGSEGSGEWRLLISRAPCAAMSSSCVKAWTLKCSPLRTLHQFTVDLFHST